MSVAEAIASAPSKAQDGIIARINAGWRPTVQDVLGFVKSATEADRKNAGLQVDSIATSTSKPADETESPKRTHSAQTLRHPTVRLCPRVLELHEYAQREGYIGNLEEFVNNAVEEYFKIVRPKAGVQHLER